MPRDPVIVNLLVLYTFILAMNAALAGALWLRYRTRLHRTLALVWVATALSFVIQGAFSADTLPMVLGFASVFAPNFALALLISISFDVPLRGKGFIIALLAGCASAILLSKMGFGFTTIALPVAVTVSLPLAVTAIRVIRNRWHALGIVGKALVVSCIAFCVHNLDYAFLRDIPEAAAFGFTLAIFIITALSITAPAVVLELVADRHARVDAELAVARRIQSNIVPKQVRLGDLDIASFMRPAESVGGDYLDAYERDGVQWLLLGDVTGHGLGAGLVMLMAQSTISAVLYARPGIEPAELNLIANQVLFRNLSRLQEKRHMTAVAIRRNEADGRFTISGCHDNILIYRANTGVIESLPVGHFPMGLGFIGDLDSTSFKQDTVELHKGDILLVSTDGVTEAAQNGYYAQGFFGEERLSAVLKENPSASVSKLKDSLLVALESFTGGVYHDDVAFLIARINPEKQGITP